MDPLGTGGAGRLADPHGIGEAGSVECGALVRLELELRDGIIQDSRYQAYGCPATLAAAAEVARCVQGMSLLKAAGLTEGGLLSALTPGTSAARSAELAIDALHGALSGAIRADIPLSAGPPGPDEPPGVLVGMSGGVDSGVAALLLRDQGYRVVGVTLSLWSDDKAADERSCCSPATVRRARRVAHALGLPHLTIDAAAPFYERVVQYFVDTYRQGRTPNPCVKCNSRVRFGTMLDLAHALGFASIATGHYARAVGEPRTLARGIDRGKDQSYVLAEVAPEILSHTLFPLGEMTKKAVRALAAQAGLEGHDAPESQEICFVADDDHRRFLQGRLGESMGTIVDDEGNVLGTHSGVFNFTVGQRKGLGVAASVPLYVNRVEADAGRVVVGPEERLRVGTVVVDGITWHRPEPAGRGIVQLRSSGLAVPARIVRPAGGTEVAVDAGPSGTATTVTIALAEPAVGVAPGQTAVFYDEERVVMGGTIVRTEAWREDSTAGASTREENGPVV